MRHRPAGRRHGPAQIRRGPGRRRWRGPDRALAAITGGLLLVLGPAVSPTTAVGGPSGVTAAWAHGSLVPPTAVLAAAGPTVTLHWSAAEDDAAAIAVALGQLPTTVLDAHLAAMAAIDDVADIEPLVTALAAEVDPQALADDPALSAYLLAHIGVAQDGVGCDGQVTDADDLLRRGAYLRFTCPEVVDRVEVTITVLTEQDPTHTTFSTDGRGDVAVHTRSQPTHTWELGAGADAAGAGRDPAGAGQDEAGATGPLSALGAAPARGTAGGAWLSLGVGLVLAAGVATRAVMGLRRSEPA